MTTYRGATFAGAFTNTVFGLLSAYILLAVYAQRPSINGYDAVDAVTFTFVVQGLLMVVSVFGDTEIADRIKSGDVVIDLYRPIDYQGYWLAERYGKAAFYAIFRGIPPLIVGALVFDLRFPTSVSTWLAFLLSTALAVAVGFGWGFLLQLTAFWILDVRGPNQLGWVIAQFLAGMFIPLFLFPAWLMAIARALPFASILQLPAETFLGKHEGADLVGVLAIQAVWAIVLIGAGRLVLARAVRRVVVQGG
ncbi:MAG: ABC-2 family transporter protein [Actinobacteria bacterium]|nr:ABC-2 family transporter protein [Actinomycetota bacterium]